MQSSGFVPSCLVAMAAALLVRLRAPAGNELASDHGVRVAAGRELEELLHVDENALKEELDQVRDHLAKFGDKLPAEINSQLSSLTEKLG